MTRRVRIDGIVARLEDTLVSLRSAGLHTFGDHKLKGIYAMKDLKIYPSLLDATEFARADEAQCHRILCKIGPGEGMVHALITTAIYGGKLTQIRSMADLVSNALSVVLGSFTVARFKTQISREKLAPPPLTVSDYIGVFWARGVTLAYIEEFKAMFSATRLSLGNPEPQPCPFKLEW